MAKRKSESPDEAEELARMTVALLACIARRLEDSASQIRVMDQFGVSSGTIGKALGISAVSVRTALHRMRRPKKK